MNASPAAALRRGIDRHLYRLRPAEPFPIRLRQRRIFVLPTRAGLVFAASVFAMLLASINYTLSLGFAFTFLLAGVGIASVFHAFRNLLQLEIRAGLAPPVHCGDPAHFELVLSDSRHRARRAIGVHHQGGSIVLNVPADGQACARLALATTRRGWQRIDRVVIDTRYPLGLVRAWSVLSPDLQVLVYPALAERAEAPPTPCGSAGGGAMSVDEDEFAGLRAHQASDSPRRVAWKAVARSGTLVSKHFAGEGGGALVFDWHALPAAMDVETRLRLLARQVVDAAHADRQYRLLLPGESLGPDHSTRHLQHCLRALALFGCGGTEDHGHA